MALPSGNSTLKASYGWSTETTAMPELATALRIEE
jgi:hypothetical protein